MRRIRVFARYQFLLLAGTVYVSNITLVQRQMITIKLALYCVPKIKVKSGCWSIVFLQSLVAHAAS